MYFCCILSGDGQIFGFPLASKGTNMQHDCSGCSSKCSCDEQILVYMIDTSPFALRTCTAAVPWVATL
jgi:hypothetical protein